MRKSVTKQNTTVKVYHGYGHTHDLVVYGHVLKKKSPERAHYTKNIPANIIHLFRLFLVKPVSGVTVTLQWRDQLLHSTTEKDGFYKFEWKSDTDVDAGWYAVTVSLVDETGNIVKSGEGKIFVPHVTQYAFISDIDDTVLVSHSATVGKRLRVLFTKHPRKRKAFRDVVTHYELLADAGTTPDVPNPFFYVSSSEWNLYDDLNDFFNHNKLPEGTFLLNQIKQWHELIKTGKTKHEGKLLRVLRILDVFPLQRFVLLGDNSQKDPAIYTSLANKFPGKIFAIYIRNIVPGNERATRELFSGLAEKGVYTCLFNDNNEAIAHSRSIGLI